MLLDIQPYYKQIHHFALTDEARAASFLRELYDSNNPDGPILSTLNEDGAVSPESSEWRYQAAITEALKAIIQTGLRDYPQYLYEHYGRFNAFTAAQARPEVVDQPAPVVPMEKVVKRNKVPIMEPFAYPFIQASVNVGAD